MATVPTLQNQVSTQGVRARYRDPTPSTALDSVGAGLMDVGSAIHQVREHEALKADEAAVLEADRQSDTVANDLYVKAQGRTFKDAIGLAPEFLSEYDKHAAEQENELKSERAKLAFRRQSYAKRGALQRQLEVYEGNQREAYYEKSREDSKVQAHMNAVTYYQDPQRVEQEIDSVAKIVAATPGLDDEQKATELNVRQSGIYAGVINRYLANDQVGKADAYYRSVKGRISGDKAALIENALSGARKQAAAEAKTAAINTQAGKILQLYSSDGPEAGSAAVAALAKSGVSPAILGEVYSKVQSGLNLVRNAKQEEHADDLASLAQSIQSGEAGPEQIDLVEQLWKDNVFSPTERATKIGQIESAFVQNAGDVAARELVRGALATGTPLDPQNDKQRKALSASFTVEARNSPPGSEPWQQLASAYAVRTRVLPEPATAWVRASLRSPNPKTAAAAAQFVGAVQAEAPDALTGFDAPTKAFAMTLSTMIAGGADPEKAVEIARQNVFETKPAIVEQRQKEFNDGKNGVAKASDSALESFIDRDFDTAFSWQPAADPGIRADFKSLTEQYYLRTGDKEAAQELAWQDVRRVYGVSEVNGVKQMMAFPPEKFGVPAAEIRKELDALGPNISLVPDALTLRLVNSLADGKPVQPSYQLMTAQGLPLTDEKGIRKRYIIPTGEEMGAHFKQEQEKARELATQQIVEAKAKRESNQQFRARAAEMLQ